MTSNDNEIREKVLEIFKRDIELEEKEIKDLEIGIFNSTIDYCKEYEIPLNWNSVMLKSIYVKKSMSLYANLKKDSYIKNEKLIEKLKMEEIKPNNVANMKKNELFPEKWEELLEKHWDKVKNSYEMSNVVSMSDNIVCKKCKSRKITYVELQTRAADENTTFYCTCTSCGYKFRF